MSRKRILLGGVPFGCNNIGDEAILAQVVSIVRQTEPNADIMVSTGAPRVTENWLAVKTCPLYGAFSGKPEDSQLFFEAMDHADVFIWSGATGLSDYPHAALDSLQAAQERGLKTIVFCTGMNDSLNPAHFKLNQGFRKSAYTLFKTMSFNTLDLVKLHERRKESDLRKRLKDVLDRCELVVNRDVQSKAQVMKSNLRATPVVAADPAITLPLVAPNADLWGEDMMAVLSSGARLIGVCISSQQAIAQMSLFAQWLDRIVDHYKVKIVFIPMNPITDFELMTQVRDAMYHKAESLVATGSSLPGAVAGLASKMDIIISSRLHLLIFAAISSTPCIGIGRGSKVSNFLSEFGFCTAGDTENIDYESLDNEVNKLFHDGKKYKEIADTVRRSMLLRLEIGIEALKRSLSTTPANSV